MIGTGGTYRMKLYRPRDLLLGVLLLLVSVLRTAPALAQGYMFENQLQGGRITDAEWKMLPKYCIDTQGYKYGRGESPNSAKWVALMGETFWHLHHYCLAIVQFERSQRREYPRVIREGYLHSALVNLQYVIDRMPPNYVLAPEIYTYVGRSHLLLGETRDADAAFTEARKLKPDYWPAYSWWASYLGDHGHVAEAQHVVEDGLKHDPKSRTLQLIKKDLDSKASQGRK